MTRTIRRITVRSEEATTDQRNRTDNFRRNDDDHHHQQHKQKRRNTHAYFTNRSSAFSTLLPILLLLLLSIFLPSFPISLLPFVPSIASAVPLPPAFTDQIDSTYCTTPSCGDHAVCMGAYVWNATAESYSLTSHACVCSKGWTNVGALRFPSDSSVTFECPVNQSGVVTIHVIWVGITFIALMYSLKKLSEAKTVIAMNYAKKFIKAIEDGRTDPGTQGGTFVLPSPAFGASHANCGEISRRPSILNQTRDELPNFANKELPNGTGSYRNRARNTYQKPSFVTAAANAGLANQRRTTPGGGGGGGAGTGGAGAGVGPQHGRTPSSLLAPGAVDFAAVLEALEADSNTLPVSAPTVPTATGKNKLTIPTSSSNEKLAESLGSPRDSPANISRRMQTINRPGDSGNSANNKASPRFSRGDSVDMMAPTLGATPSSSPTPHSNSNLKLQTSQPPSDSPRHQHQQQQQNGSGITTLHERRGRRVTPLQVGSDEDKQLNCSDFDEADDITELIETIHALSLSRQGSAGTDAPASSAASLNPSASKVLPPPPPPAEPPSIPPPSIALRSTLADVLESITDSSPIVQSPPVLTDHSVHPSRSVDAAFPAPPIRHVSLPLTRDQSDGCDHLNASTSLELGGSTEFGQSYGSTPGPVHRDTTRSDGAGGVSASNETSSFHASRRFLVHSPPNPNRQASEATSFSLHPRSTDDPPQSRMLGSHMSSVCSDDSDDVVSELIPRSSPLHAPAPNRAISPITSPSALPAASSAAGVVRRHISQRSREDLAAIAAAVTGRPLVGSGASLPPHSPPSTNPHSYTQTIANSFNESSSTHFLLGTPPLIPQLKIAGLVPPDDVNLVNARKTLRTLYSSSAGVSTAPVTDRPSDDSARRSISGNRQRRLSDSASPSRHHAPPRRRASGGSINNDAFTKDTPTRRMSVDGTDLILGPALSSQRGSRLFPTRPSLTTLPVTALMGPHPILGTPANIPDKPAFILGLHSQRNERKRPSLDFGRVNSLRNVHNMPGVSVLEMPNGLVIHHHPQPTPRLQTAVNFDQWSIKFVLECFKHISFQYSLCAVVGSLLQVVHICVQLSVETRMSEDYSVVPPTHATVGIDPFLTISYAIGLCIFCIASHLFCASHLKLAYSMAGLRGSTSNRRMPPSIPPTPVAAGGGNIGVVPNGEDGPKNSQANMIESRRQVRPSQKNSSINAARQTNLLIQSISMEKESLYIKVYMFVHCFLACGLLLALVGAPSASSPSSADELFVITFIGSSIMIANLGACQF